jgi:hypothetical protein
MKKIATYLIALLVLVLSFFVAKFVFLTVFSAVVRTVILVACGALVLVAGASALRRKR